MLAIYWSDLNSFACFVGREKKRTSTTIFAWYFHMYHFVSFLQPYKGLSCLTLYPTNLRAGMSYSCPSSSLLFS